LTLTKEDPSASLIEAARTDKMAFSSLFRRHYDEIFRYCARRLPSRANAEDVTSQVFLKMVKNFDSFTGNETGFRCWLFRIACNEINSFYRRSARQQKAMENVRRESAGQDCSSDEASDIENQEKIEFLRNAIGTLTPTLQDIVTLRYYEGLNSEQIGKILGLNPATVRSRLSRSLKKLQKHYRLHRQQNAEEIFSYDG